MGLSFNRYYLRVGVGEPEHPFPRQLVVLQHLLVDVRVLGALVPVRGKLQFVLIVVHILLDLLHVYVGISLLFFLDVLKTQYTSLHFGHAIS